MSTNYNYYDGADYHPGTDNNGGPDHHSAAHDIDNVGHDDNDCGAYDYHPSSYYHVHSYY